MKPFGAAVADRILEREDAKNTALGRTGTVTTRVHELTSRPTCAVCGRPVERMTEEEDDFGGEVIFRAYCHGQVDKIALPMNDACLKSISFGTAFNDVPRRLESE